MTDSLPVHVSIEVFWVSVVFVFICSGGVSCVDAGELEGDKQLGCKWIQQYFGNIRPNCLSVWPVNCQGRSVGGVYRGWLAGWVLCL